MEELADIHRRGNTIIMVTHNPDLTSYASRVITMLDGKIDTDSKKDITSPFKKRLEVKTDQEKPVRVPAAKPQPKKPAKKPTKKSKRKAKK